MNFVASSGSACVGFPELVASTGFGEQLATPAREAPEPAILGDVVDPQEFQQVVSAYYQPLYRFALGLTGQEDAAWDLTQQTFYRWATKSHQLEDKSKAKAWLFTTLHREFLNINRHNRRFPHQELEASAPELPVIAPTAELAADQAIVWQKLQEIEESYRAPLLLFYLENHSYREIAAILGIAEGTVMSRISRGKALLRQQLLEPAISSANHPPGSGGSSSASNGPVKETSESLSPLKTQMSIFVEWARQGCRRWFGCWGWNVQPLLRQSL